MCLEKIHSSIIKQVGQMKNSLKVRGKGRPRNFLGHTQTINNDSEIRWNLIYNRTIGN